AGLRAMSARRGSAPGLWMRAAGQRSATLGTVRIRRGEPARDEALLRQDHRPLHRAERLPVDVLVADDRADDAALEQRQLGLRQELLGEGALERAQGGVRAGRAAGDGALV